MKYLKAFIGIAFTTILLVCSFAQTVAAERSSITVRGRKSIVVTTPKVRLGDLAIVTNKDSKDEEAVIELKRLEVADAPHPGKKKALLAHDVIEALKAHGTNVNSFGYLFPRTMKVERAARVLTYHEVEQAVLDYLDQDERDIGLKSIRYNEQVKVAPGPVELSVRSYQHSSSGVVGLSITVQAEGAPRVRFQTQALIDEWREVPIAKRSIQAGQLVGESDFKMARMNIKELPKDAATDSSAVVGLSATRMITAGEVFKRNNLLIPPVVRSGSIVTIRYKSRLVEATATGKALESGAIGDEIKVRNTGSGKTVTASVIETGLVGVSR